MTLTLIAIAMILLLSGAPIAIALGLSSAVVFIFYQPIPTMSIIPQLIGESSTSFILMAIPMFIFAGNLMEQGTMGRKLIDLMTAFVGWMKGGLGAVNILGSMVFGGISGSSVADTATFGTILVPRMTEQNYPKAYAAAVTLCSSSLAVVIPPSILMVIAASSTNQSVAKALAAGLLPGILITVLLMVVNYVISSKKHYGTKVPFSWRNAGTSLKTCWTSLLAPLIILGSIFSGIVTPTEGAAIAVLYVLLVDGVIMRKLTWKTIYRSAKDAALLTSAIMFIVASSALINWIMTFEGVPKMLASLAKSIPGGKTGFLILLNIVLLFIGMTIDAGPACIVFPPLFMPIAASVGVSPTHFLVIMVVGFAVGLVTPPYGVCLFSISTVTKIRVEEIVKCSWPFYITLFISMLLVSFLPDISLLVPRLLGL